MYDNSGVCSNDILRHRFQVVVKQNSKGAKYSCTTVFRVRGSWCEGDVIGITEHITDTEDSEISQDTTLPNKALMLVNSAEISAHSMEPQISQKVRRLCVNSASRQSNS